MVYFWPKNTFSQVKHLFNITFNHLCGNSSISMCNFRNHKSKFTTKLVRILLVQTFHNFNKSNPSKCQFSDFSLLVFKFTKFLMPFFKQKLSFPSIFGSLSSVMKGKFSVHFQVKLYIMLTKQHINVKSFKLEKARIKIYQIPHAIFKTKSNKSQSKCKF